MSEFVKVVQDGIVTGDITIIGVLLAILVVLLTIVVFAFRGGSNKRRGILLVGLCDSGKTLVYSRLVDNRYVNSYTSVKENSGVYSVEGAKSTNLRIIDLPGHERLRTKYLDQYKSQARGIVFVIDSMTVTKDIKEVGEYLYTLLTDKALSQGAPPLLVACNKQDQTLAKGARLVQANLEKEINTVRKTKAAALVGTDNTSNNNTFLGARDKDFSFSELKPFRVDFVECSARGNKEGAEPDLEAVTDWLANLA